jgi:CRISPR-associated protein Csx17
LEDSSTTIWNTGDLCRNLAAVLERRVMDGRRAGCDRPPLAFRKAATLDAVSAFIAGETDDERIIRLLLGMLLIDHRKPYPVLKKTTTDAPPLPRAYALLKLLFLPGPITTETGDTMIRSEASILPLLRAERTNDACQIAIRRLRASGFVPQAHKTITQWESSDPARLAAALIIPVASLDVATLQKMVLRPSNINTAGSL